MRLSAINFNNFSLPIRINSAQAPQAAQTPSKLERTPACDSVSFRSVPKGDLLRKLLPYGVPDLYTGIVMMDSSSIQGILQKRIFSGAIKNVVKAMAPHEQSLLPVEKDVFSIIKSASKVFPRKRVEDVLHELVPMHQKRLRELQRPIFDKLTELSKEMPEKSRAKFDELMELTKQKLTYEPIIEEFSPKEFQYKIKRINEGIQKRGNPYEISTMKKLIKLSYKFSKRDAESEFEVIARKKNLKQNKKTVVIQNYTRRQAENLRQMDKILTHSPLAKDRELNDLFITTRARIYKIPTVSAFNRKSFIYELQKITDELKDTKLAHRMVQTAIKLPTSKQDISAFITKCADYSSEKIGYELLEGSLGTVDHLTPVKSGGENCLVNYGLASKRANSDRGHKTFARLLLEHPEIYSNSQRQVNRLIELYNSGVFSRIGLSRSYITSYISKLYKMSPSDNRLIIDISKLKP